MATQEKRYRPALTGLLGPGLLALVAAGAAGQDAESAGPETPETFAGTAPIPDEMLDEQRAMANIQVDRIQINDQDLTSVFTGNIATGNLSGNNTVADGAFSQAAGFMTTIQNTGNNVVIQNATIINVAIEP